MVPSKLSIIKFDAKKPQHLHENISKIYLIRLCMYVCKTASTQCAVVLFPCPPDYSEL